MPQTNHLRPVYVYREEGYWGPDIPPHTHAHENTHTRARALIGNHRDVGLFRNTGIDPPPLETQRAAQPALTTSIQFAAIIRLPVKHLFPSPRSNNAAIWIRVCNLLALQ